MCTHTHAFMVVYMILVSVQIKFILDILVPFSNLRFKTAFSQLSNFFQQEIFFIEIKKYILIYFINANMGFGVISFCNTAILILFALENYFISESTAQMNLYR